MQRHYDGPRGRIDRFEIELQSLAGNLLGEPLRREIAVWLPPGDHRDLPLIVELAAYGNSGASAGNWTADRENRFERLDRLVGSGAMAPVAVAVFDSWTRLGGNQHIDTPVLGHWSRAIQHEIVPAVEARHGCGGPGRRGVFGKSSGGYGALAQACGADSIWDAAASLSGDMGFDLAYAPDWPKALTHLARWDHDPVRFLAAYEENRKPSGGDRMAISLLALCASYDPDPSAPLGLRLPADPRSGLMIAERWANWLAHDPVVMAPAAAVRLKRLKGLFIDCGNQDEYNLHYGARRLSAALTAAGIEHAHEEFPDGHMNLDYRLDRALPWLSARLHG